jgi:PAS domain S-box-containing protein
MSAYPIDGSEDAAASEQLFRGLLESAPDAMVIVDGDGTILLVNAQTEALFGYTRNELVGRPVDLLVPDRLRDRHPGYRQGYARARRARLMGEGLELSGLHKNGREVPVEISLSPLSTPGGLLISAAIRDVSERRHAQAELTRLYEEQRRVALTLQHSLMGQPPEIPGVVTARRYRPATAGAGVGGDWFDLVNLGVGRAGVFIGDVMGRGLEAAAVMGQLRSAGNALARTGMGPRRLMQALDAVVADLPDQLVTCCYLVADWDAGEVTVSSAGHLPVLAVTADGDVAALPVPVGVPLGVGDVPQQQVCLPLRAGSTLVLYTDGLVETRCSDIELQIKALTVELLTAFESGAGLETAADRVLSALLPAAEADDDVTLLFVRLPPAPVAATSLKLAADAASVREARRFVADTLAEWGCSKVADTLCLLTSEAVTNAVRHGRGPLRFRVRRTADEVTVMVTDRSTHALPRPRSTRDDAESGRGLLLVDALADRWGTSPVENGKTVWFSVDLAEDSVPARSRR